MLWQIDANHKSKTRPDSDIAGRRLFLPDRCVFPACLRSTYTFPTIGRKRVSLWPPAGLVLVWFAQEENASKSKFGVAAEWDSSTLGAICPSGGGRGLFTGGVDLSLPYGWGRRWNCSFCLEIICVCQIICYAIFFYEIQISRFDNFLAGFLIRRYFKLGFRLTDLGIYCAYL